VSGGGRRVGGGTLTITLQGGGRVTVSVERRRLERPGQAKAFGARGKGGGHQAQFVPVDRKMIRCVMRRSEKEGGMKILPPPPDYHPHLPKQG
jgi:hypothetical protein